MDLRCALIGLRVPGKSIQQHIAKAKQKPAAWTKAGAPYHQATDACHVSHMTDRLADVGKMPMTLELPSRQVCCGATR